MKNGTTSLVHPEIRSIHSPDLEPPALPADPYDCEISFVVRIGARGAQSEEAFTFSVITPVRLAKSAEGVGGRGRLIMPAFEWAEVARSLAGLLAKAARPTWADVTRTLNEELHMQRDGEPS